jgi:hypothetical protein
MTCTTCNGEGRIVDRRVNNRNKEEEIEAVQIIDESGNITIEEELEYIKKDWKSYSYPETSRYACKIDYNEEAKEVIAYLRKLGKSSGFTVRVRGSGPRAPQHRKDGKDLRHEYDQSLPLKYAEQVRIYIDHK